MRTVASLPKPRIPSLRPWPPAGRPGRLRGHQTASSPRGWSKPGCGGLTH